MWIIKKNKSAFTLIEMLIVIVIIGILAVAIFPKLWWAQARARDVARKADLQNVATALVTYQIDKWHYIENSGSLQSISWELISAGLDFIPKDPLDTRSFDWLWDSAITDGQYWYTPISKYGISNNAFVIMAASETEWWSNWSFIDGTIDKIVGTTKYEDVILCDNFTLEENPGANCEYAKENDQLRYLYMY